MARAIAVRELREAGRRQGRALLEGGHRRHARRAQGRGQGGDQRHADADECGDEDRPRLERDAGGRDVGPHGLEEQVDGLGDAEAGDDADGRGEHAERERLGDHGAEHLAAAGAEGAQHRELAAPLRHGDAEGVEDDERADEDGDAGERQQHRRQEGVDRGGRLVGRVGGRLLAGLDAHRRRQGGLDARGELLGRDAGIGGDRDAAQLAGLAAPALHVLQAAGDDDGAAHGAGVAPREHAGDLDVLEAGRGGDVEAVARLEALLRRRSS